MARRPIPKRVRFTVLERDGFACRYCGAKAPVVPLHVDHVVAVSRGGSDDVGNLITSCQDCNLGKGAMVLMEGVGDLPERAIAASIMSVALERFGPDLPAHSFALLLDFSLMDGPQPHLITLVATAATWAEAERALYRDAGYPHEFWINGDPE